MPRIEDELLKLFLDRLLAADEVTQGMVDQLRDLLTQAGKLKADDLVQLFSPPSEEAIP